MKWLSRIFFLFGCVALYIGVASAIKLVEGYGGLGAIFVWIVFIGYAGIGALIFFALALTFFLIGRRRKKNVGLPPGAHK